MPLFEFTCQKCEATFEEILSLAELEVGELQCPKCGSERVRRALSTFNTGSVATDLPPCGAPSPGACGTGGFT